MCGNGGAAIGTTIWWWWWHRDADDRVGGRAGCGFSSHTAISPSTQPASLTFISHSLCHTRTLLVSWPSSHQSSYTKPNVKWITSLAPSLHMSNTSLAHLFHLALDGIRLSTQIIICCGSFFQAFADDAYTYRLHAATNVSPTQPVDNNLVSTPRRVTQAC